MHIGVLIDVGIGQAPHGALLAAVTAVSMHIPRRYGLQDLGAWKGFVPRVNLQFSQFERHLRHAPLAGWRGRSCQDIDDAHVPGQHGFATEFTAAQRIVISNGHSVSKANGRLKCTNNPTTIPRLAIRIDMANTATFRAHYEGREYHRIIQPLSISVMAKGEGGGRHGSG